MSELLKKIIIDAQEASIDPFLPRELQVSEISGKPTAIIGVRRAGKSTYLNQIKEKLLTRAETKEAFVSVNFVDERIRPLRTEILTDIEESYFELFPEYESKKRYWFLDEIQLVPDWEYFVERLSRNKLNQVYITGSSATMLSKEMASALRGRPLCYEIFPYSFYEVLTHNNLATSKPSSSIERKRKILFDTFLMEGGFPEVWGLKRNDRLRILSEYYRSILARDLIERHNPRDSRAVEICMKHLTTYTSRLLSLNKLKNNLQAQGVRTTTAYLGEILEWLIEAYFLFSVPI